MYIRMAITACLFLASIARADVVPTPAPTLSPQQEIVAECVKAIRSVSPNRSARSRIADLLTCMGAPPPAASNN